MEPRNKAVKTISLITSFSFPGKKDASFVTPEGMETIRDLLSYVGAELNYSLFAPGGDDVDEDLEVLVNGKALWAIPEGLGRKLEEGDTVKISMLTLGGG